MENYKRVLGILEEDNLDSIRVSDGYNMRYISGFTGGTGNLYISKNKRIILTDFRYVEQASRESSDFQVIEVINNNYVEALNKLLLEDNAKSLGLEDKIITYNEYLDYQKNVKVNSLVPLGDKLNELRSVKTEEEINIIKKAESIGDITFTKILDILKPDITERDIATELEYIMKKNGAEGLSFNSIVASGINSSMPHATPSNKKLEYGDFLTLDFGCVYKGYCSDMTRTVVIGKATDQQKKVYRTVLEAQEKSLDFIKSGYLGREIDNIARNHINQAGYEGYFGHGLGHSLGLCVHENPRLSPIGDTIIKTNMVVTIEPGIYIPKFGGVRIEDLIVVKEDGYINLTQSNKNLIEL